MTTRIDPFTAAPELMKQFYDYSIAVNECGLEKSLLELVKVRASQINGCANCLNMHTADARKQGETEQRLHLVAGWREAPVFSDRERAALAWTEYLTQVSGRTHWDDPYETLEAQFSEEEQLKLTLVINTINAWNRLAVGFRLYNPKLGW